jgi:HK97 family phage portal protein
MMNIFGKAWHAVKTFTARTVHVTNWFRGLAASWSAPTFANLAKRAYANPFAARGLRVIAQSAAAVQLVVSDGKTMTYDHEVLKLLKRPAPRTSWVQFCDQFVSHIYCGGEIFLEKRSPVTGPNRGKPKQLKLWSPGDFVGFIKRGINEPAGFFELLSPEAQGMAQKGDVIGYTFTTPGGTPVSFTTDQMLHARIYNPTDPDRGLPLLIGAARALETMEASDDWNRSIAAGGGRVPGYWVPKGLPDGVQLNKDQIEAAEAALDKRTTERAKSNLGMVLSGAFDRVDGSVTPKDADWLEGYRANARAVGTVMGVSPELLGDEKSGSLTDAGVNSQIRALYILTTLPLFDWLLSELNAWLMPAYGAGTLEYDDESIDALQYDLDQKYRRYREAAGRPIISVAEGREGLRLPNDKLAPELFEIATPIGVARPAAPVPAPLRSVVTHRSALDRLLELTTEAA